MIIEISRREVLNNLIRFKDYLLEMREDEGRDPMGKYQNEERSYKVLLNRRTGDMRFAQKISSLEGHFHKRGKQKTGPGDWKEIRIIVHLKPNVGVRFEMRDASDRELNAADFDPLAWRIAKETLDVLNLKGKGIKKVDAGTLPEEAVLQDLTSIHLGKLRESIEDLPGWFGPITRIEAEKLLASQPEGTYLIREADETMALVASNLSRANHIEIHPYLLTLVENDRKISDILLLETHKGWTFYADDPNLKDPFYHFHSSPHVLIHILSARARRPMFPSPRRAA